MQLYGSILSMKYKQCEVIEKLGVTRNTVIKQSKKLSIGKRVGNKTLYTEEEFDLLKKTIKIYKIPPIVVSNNGIEAIINISGIDVVIDSEDLEKIQTRAWQNSGNNYFKTNYKNKNLYLHRFIMGEPEGFAIDHINHNKLDNRKSNLRICTRAENQWNRGLQKNNSSGYKGITFNKTKGKWQSYIKHNKKNVFVGHFNTPEEAYAAYCKAAKELHGEFARLA